MKKLLSLLFSLSLLFCLVSPSVAQTFTMVGNGVTVTNGGTSACSLKVASAANTVTIQAVLTKTSGTVAGTLTLQGSNDGVNYETVPTSLVAGAASTYTATDVATQAKSFVITGSPFLFYKLSWTGSGTMAATMSGYVLPRNYTFK